LYNEPEIIQGIRAASLRWMELTFTNSDGARKIGRPPMKWMVLKKAFKEVKLTTEGCKKTNQSSRK
jgi:hypothetical protein